MPPRKSKKADLRRTYGLFVEISLVAALLLLILAFRSNTQPKKAMDFTPEDQVVIPIEETPQTVMRPKPLPPPPPPVPLVVPDNRIIEEEAIIFDPVATDPATLEFEPPAIEETDEEDVEIYEFFAVKELPEMIGGAKALYEKIEYPEMARRAHLEGRVVIQFIVDEKGRVVDPVVLKGVHPMLDEAALKALRQVQFTPGRQRTKPVPVRMSLPVMFRLR